MADRMAVIPEVGDQAFELGQRPVHDDHPHLVVHLVEKRHLPCRHLENLERIGRGEHPRHAVGHAHAARLVDEGAVLQGRLVHLVGSLARRVEGRVAAAHDLELGAVARRPIGAGNVWCGARGGTCGHRQREPEANAANANAIHETRLPRIFRSLADCTPGPSDTAIRGSAGAQTLGHAEIWLSDAMLRKAIPVPTAWCRRSRVRRHKMPATGVASGLDHRSISKPARSRYWPTLSRSRRS